MESGLNVWVWLVGKVSRRPVWLMGVGGIRHEAIMLFFGPLCYSPMLQTMSDYAIEISRLFFFIKINFTKQVTQYHSFTRISTIIMKRALKCKPSAIE